MTANQVPKPPHGIYGLDTSANHSWMVWLGFGLLMAVILGITYWYWQRSRQKPLVKITLEQRIQVKISALVEMTLNSAPVQADYLARLSSGLRSALECLVSLNLTDMTFPEIEGKLPKHWPLTKPLREFIQHLEELDRGIYQNRQFTEQELLQLKDRTLAWMQIFEQFARLEK